MENPRIENRDIIMFGLQPWDIEMGSNFKDMAVEIARHNRVLYVNRPLDRISYIKHRSDKKIKARILSFKKKQGVLQSIRHNLWVLNPPILLESINWMPSGILYNYFNKRNNNKIAGQIREAKDQLNFKSVILIIDNDFFNALYLKEYLQVDLMLYYIRDYLLSQPYFKLHGEIAEPAIIAKADVVIANSLYLCNYAKKFNANSFYIGQGCDVESFIMNSNPVPQDVANIKRPVIGYCGNLTASRLDIALLENIATQRPHWNFVLVGPQDNFFKNSVLNKMNNVLFTGSKPAAELPAYVHHFDVCLNPQQINQMTIGNYPRKIDEYLAAGKPVVATATVTMEEFKNHAYLCNNAQEYVIAIEKALKEKDDSILAQARVTFALSHTWQASVQKLYNTIYTPKK